MEPEEGAALAPRNNEGVLVPAAYGVELVALPEATTEPMAQPIAEFITPNTGAEDIAPHLEEPVSNDGPGDQRLGLAAPVKVTWGWLDTEMPMSTAAFPATGGADGTDGTVGPREANAVDAGGSEGGEQATTSTPAVPDNEEEEGLCVVCFDEPAGTRLEPCGHSYFCQHCAARYSTHRRRHHHYDHHYDHHHSTTTYAPPPPSPRFRTCPLCRAPLVLAMNGTPYIEGINDTYNHQAGAAAAAGRSQEVLSDM